MTYQDLRREYPEKICICRPHLRDVKSRRVVSWICLGVVDSIEAAQEAIERFELDGVADAVAISTSEEMEIVGGLAAKYFRVFLGME